MREWLATAAPRGILLGIVVAAFAVRTVFLWGAVFGGSGVNYQDSDAWYHMRLIENLAPNFPHRASHDPYLGTPAPPVSVQAGSVEVSPGWATAAGAERIAAAAPATTISGVK